MSRRPKLSRKARAEQRALIAEIPDHFLLGDDPTPISVRDLALAVGSNERATRASLAKLVRLGYIALSPEGGAP